MRPQHKLPGAKTGIRASNRCSALHRCLAVCLGLVPAWLFFALIVSGGAQPINDLVFAVGTTIQNPPSTNWSYVLVGAPQAQLLAGKHFAIYGKPGAPTNAVPFTARGTIFQQTDPTAINNLLNQSVALNENLASLSDALNQLLHNVPGAGTLLLPQKVLVAFQFAAGNPGAAQSLELITRQHPGLSLCAGRAFSEPITTTTTYEIRDVNPATGIAGDVLGRVTITPGSPTILPAPGFPFQVQTNAPSDHLRIRLRWGTPDSLRRLSLLQYGFDVWRIPRAAAIAAGYNTTPPPTSALTTDPNFTRVNAGPVMTTRDYAPLPGFAGPDDPSDRTTYFFADNHGRALGSISPTNNVYPPGYLVPPFNDGDQFYYFITARDVLGRDGLVSPGGPATAYRQMPPKAPTNPQVLNAVLPGTTNIERLLITWQQNNNTTDRVKEYWVYKWPNPTMALTNDAAPASNRIAIVAQISNTNWNSAFDNASNNYYFAGPASSWYTIRAISTNAGQVSLASPNTPPVSGVLRERTAPSAPTGDLLSSCGSPVAVFQTFNSLVNPNGPDTNNWNYRVTCQRRDSGIAWVRLVLGDPYAPGAQSFGPLYFPPNGDSLSLDFPVQAAGASPNFVVWCYAGTYYGEVSSPATCQNTNPVPPGQIAEASFSCGELLFTALNSNDPFLQAVNGGQGACYPAINPIPDASGTVRMTFDPALGRPRMLIQYGTMTNTITLWHDLGVATSDSNGFYSVFYEPCLIGPLPPFRGCVVNLPGDGFCDQHVARAGDGGAVAPIYIRFHPTPRMQEYRLYRSVNGGEHTLIAQGAALFDQANQGKVIVRSDDSMPPSATRACYFVQALDENGNGSPLALIGCRDILPPKPPRPVLSEPTPIGDTNFPQVALSWFCPTAGVYRFEVLIRRADQAAAGGGSTGFTSPQLIPFQRYNPKSRFFGLQSEVLAIDLFDESQFTPPVGPGFGPGPQFTLNANVLPGVPYYISVHAENAHGDWGDASSVWSFMWKPPPTVQTVPWPARPLPPVTTFDDPGATNSPYAPRVAAVLFTNYDGTLADQHYPVGIRFAEIPNTDQRFINIGNTNFAGYHAVGPGTPASPGVDPNSGVFGHGATTAFGGGQRLLPIVVYRQQVTNANFPRVSGNLTQVSPLLERVPWMVDTVTNPVTVTISDRLIALDHVYLGNDVYATLLYLRDQQPVMVGARYHYYVVRLNAQREVAETIDAGMVDIPAHP